MNTISIVKNEAFTQLGGRHRKKNGHKSNCGCPICKNMKKTKRGGEDPEIEFNMGGKKKNGHKSNCGCPICVNMKHAKGTKRNKRNKRGGSKRRRRVGGEDKDEAPNGMKEEEEEIVLNEDTDEDSDEDSDEEFIDIDMKEKDIKEKDMKEKNMKEDDIKEKDMKEEGGRRRKKSNGHKANCKCPICKNMKKSKRGGDDGDELDVMEKGPMEKADDDDYEKLDELDLMERGPDNSEQEVVVDKTTIDPLIAAEEGNSNPYNPEAYENVGGRRRRNKTRKGRKSRKHKSRRHRKRTRRHRRKM